MGYLRESFLYGGYLSRKFTSSLYTNNSQSIMRNAHMPKEHFDGDIVTLLLNWNKMFLVRDTALSACPTTSNRSHAEELL
tara:strand:- start:1937 stop:2176 length:240 start_codon:yes stop_codon:yes gene_type:complete